MFLVMFLVIWVVFWGPLSRRCPRPLAPGGPRPAGLRGPGWAGALRRRRGRGESGSCRRSDPHCPLLKTITIPPPSRPSQPNMESTEARMTSSTALHANPPFAADDTHARVVTTKAHHAQAVARCWGSSQVTTCGKKGVADALVDAPEAPAPFRQSAHASRCRHQPSLPCLSRGRPRPSAWAGAIGNRGDHRRGPQVSRSVHIKERWGMPFATSSQSTSSCRSVPPTKDKANFFATTMVGSDFHRLATATGRRGHIAEVADGTVAPAPNPNPATQHPPPPTGAC
jgi:hypothetical protein